MRKLLIALGVFAAVAVGSPSAAVAGLYEEGKAEHKKKNFATACKFWREGAVQNDAKSYNAIGRCYFKGWEGKKDYKIAIGYFRTAVEMGWYEAFANLAIMYRQGFGVPKDTERADKLEKQAHILLKQAAEGGDAFAQFNLGLVYANGQGVPQNFNTAVKWFNRAAEKGHAQAQHNLGFMYKYGLGIPQDYETAFKWLTRAAEQGLDGAQFTLGRKYLGGLDFPPDFNTAFKWFTLAAEQGGGPAQASLGAIITKDRETSRTPAFKPGSVRRFLTARRSVKAFQ